MISALRRKFVLIAMLLVSAVLFSVFLGICFYHRSSMEQRSYVALQLALTHRGEAFPWLVLGDEVPTDFQENPIFTVLVQPNGRTAIVSSDRISVNEEQLRKIVIGVLESGNTRGKLSEYDLRYVTQYHDNGSTRIAFRSTYFERSRVCEVILITAAFVIAAFFIFLIAGILLSHWAFKPVEKAWAQQSQFMADASHELKTPLTIILANSGILKSNPDITTEQLFWVNSTEKEADRMKVLVEDMLFLAKYDDSLTALEKIQVNFSGIVDTEALSFESVAFERNLSLEVDAVPDINVLGNEPRLRQLVAILVDNATKYAKDDSIIKVTLNKQQANALLCVLNESESISPEQQKHLFERFYRTDVSRSTTGAGLGLSIAKTIVDDHKGKIAVHSDEYGTRFTVSIPLLP